MILLYLAALGKSVLIQGQVEQLLPACPGLLGFDSVFRYRCIVLQGLNSTDHAPNFATQFFTRVMSSFTVDMPIQGSNHRSCLINLCWMLFICFHWLIAVVWVL